MLVSQNHHTLANVNKWKIRDTQIQIYLKFDSQIQQLNTACLVHCTQEVSEPFAENFQQTDWGTANDMWPAGCQMLPPQ